MRSKSGNTIATLGRGDTDIFVGGSSIAKTQCSFEIDLDNNVVMLYDRSHGCTTQVFGEDAMPFEHGRIRKIVVQKNLNTTIGMGGQRQNLIQFRLLWYQGSTETEEKIKNRQGNPDAQEENPRLARTIDDLPTILPSQRETRVHPAGHQQLMLRYVLMGDALGSGQFGTVHKCRDVDSGKLMAVKVLEPSPGTSRPEDWNRSVYCALKREVETLSEISDPNIVDYIASQRWNEPRVEIFMGLKEGTLESLIRSGCDPVSIVRDVFRQMLQALDCLAWKGIIHRDVKPENILYLSQESGQYQFQLGDFGLCNRAISAVTSVGTPIYMAPEMGRKGGQTHKADVWSLFVTLLWTLDEEDFRQRSTQFKCYEDVLEAILSAASRGERISAIREMAIVNVEERASAAQMLAKWCNGKGLSTPLNQIPSLDNRPSFSLTAIRPTALPSAPTPRTRTVQTRQRALRGNVPVPVATRYRINKAHDSLHPTPSRQS